MKVFVKPGCPWCIESTRWLEDNGYELMELGPELLALDASSLRNVNTPEDLRDAGLSFPG